MTAIFIADATGGMMNISLHHSHGSVTGRKDRLVEDLKGVVADADDLLQALGNATVEEFSEARARIENRLLEVKSRLDNARISATRQAGNMLDATQFYVSKNPWKSFGIPAVVGVIVFLLLSRHE
jgi:ElaB/YqjD/DUF883 family membrane-anchored ribosome-binding protein